MRILVIASHNDDAELGCYGSLCHLANKSSIKVVVMARNGDAQSEEQDSNLQLIHPWDSKVYRRVDEGWNAMFEDAYVQVCSYRPSLIFLQDSDGHPDHNRWNKVFQRAILRGAADTTVLNYRPHRRTSWKPNVFIPLSVNHLDRKIAACQPYAETQPTRKYLTPEIIRATAVMDGQLAGLPLAEAFYSEKVILHG